YPFNQAIFQKTDSIAFRTPVTFFVGENGTGKSTLLTAICKKCNIPIWQGIGGTRYKPNPYEKVLYLFMAVKWTNGSVPGSFFSSATFKDFAKYLDEGATVNPEIFKYFGGESLITQSHGQSLMSLFRGRYKIKGLYFLDEPETALSPKSQLELLTILNDMSIAGHAQFIVATHSPILLACPGADIYSFDQMPVKQVTYEETEHYKIYKDFMQNQDPYLPNK
ncbi:MAG: AAA family ATPase, partial [Desulfobacterales bacterium]|nr:AAA family ATPase [Desulfobacterales bacterium]